MPMFGDKKFPYTPAGKKAAKARAPKYPKSTIARFRRQTGGE